MHPPSPAQVCVSLIQWSVCSLGQLLHLLLQSFMSSVTSPANSAESASILQLFLETYFMEVVGEGARELVGDEQQALLTLLRSYLAGLTNPLPGPPMMEVETMVGVGPGDMFGPRHDYLDLLPPATECPTLLKLQSLLCSSYSDSACRETVARYLEERPGLECRASLQLLATTSGGEAATFLCQDGHLLLLRPYCLSQGEPRVWAEVLQVLLDQPSSRAKQVSKRGSKCGRCTCSCRRPWTAC